MLSFDFSKYIITLISNQTKTVSKGAFVTGLSRDTKAPNFINRVVMYMEKKTVMFNADMGEGFGNYQFGNDEELMPYMTIVNFACGFHAGDPVIMNKSVKLAAKNGVKVGAHPGFRDMQGFGRRMIWLSPEELYCDVLYQLGALDAFLKKENMKLNHICPHGKMDPLVSENKNYAEAFADAVYDYDPKIKILLESKCLLKQICDERNIEVINVGYPDVEYDEDGEMIIETQKHYINPGEVAQRALHMIKDGYYESRKNRKFPIKAEALCFHGDIPNCVEIVKTVRKLLTENDINII